MNLLNAICKECICVSNVLASTFTAIYLRHFILHRLIWCLTSNNWTSLIELSWFYTKTMLYKFSNYNCTARQYLQNANKKTTSKLSILALSNWMVELFISRRTACSFNSRSLSCWKMFVYVHSFTYGSKNYLRRPFKAELTNSRGIKRGT